MKKLLMLAILALVLCASMHNVYAQTAPSSTTTPAQTPDIPRLISYQGLLTSTNGQPVPDGTHLLTIRFYSDAQGEASALWQDNFTVVTTNGVFSILLGSQAPLPEASVMAQPMWIGVSVDSTELRPLSQLTSSPYAMNVANGAITTEKMGTDYVGSISVNGAKVSGKGSNVNLVAGDGLCN